MSMAAHGSRRLLAMAANAAEVIGIEALAAAQGCDFHAPLRSSESGVGGGAGGDPRGGADFGRKTGISRRICGGLAALVRSGVLAEAVGVELPGVGG